MRAAVISLGSVSSKWIVDELKKYFKEVDDLSLEDIEVPLGSGKTEVLYKGKPIEKYDCIYARGSYKYAILLRAITTILQKESYMPLRAASYTLGHDKVLTHLKFQEFGVPQPRTYLAATADAGKKIVKKMSYPIVMKLPSGTHGKGVMFADSTESAKSMIDTLSLLKQPILLQEFIDTDGVDYRAIVVGDEVVAAMKRIAGKDDKRSNIHAGGKGVKTSLDEKTKKVAIAAARATGCDICAVDILPSHKGPLVMEINLSPGLQGITGATKINVAAKMAEFLFKKAKEMKEKGKSAVVSEVGQEHEIHGPVDFRGNRILLPEVVTMASKIKETDNVVITAKKGKIEIKKGSEEVKKID